MKFNVPIQSLIDHIKTAVDVDPWAKEMVEELLGVIVVPGREKVIKGLQHCDNAGCVGCPYYIEESDASCKLNKEAIELINAQEAKIKALEQTIEDICCGGGAG